MGSDILQHLRPVAWNLASHNAGFLMIDRLSKTSAVYTSHPFISKFISMSLSPCGPNIRNQIVHTE